MSKSNVNRNKMLYWSFLSNCLLLLSPPLDFTYFSVTFYSVYTIELYSLLNHYQQNEILDKMTHISPAIIDVKRKFGSTGDNIWKWSNLLNVIERKQFQNVYNIIWNKTFELLMIFLKIKIGNMLSVFIIFVCIVVWLKFWIAILLIDLMY